MKPKNYCLLGLILFVASYIMFSQGQEFSYYQKHIDFAHWFNLIAAVLLVSFNHVFPKNKLNSIASFVTIIGVIAHIGLCTIDLIMWSFGNDNNSRTELSDHLNNILHNGILTLTSCILFASGLAILLYRNEVQNLKNKEL